MKKIIFSLPAKALGEATEAILLGDFNNWDINEAKKLEIQEDGTLKTEILLEGGKTYEYRFLLNDGTWVNDWAADSYSYKHDFAIENSVITVPADVIIVEETLIVETQVKKKKSAKAKTTTPKLKKPAKVAEATTESNDDLTKIEGIGPKIAKLLHAEGITTYKQLGSTTAKKLKNILEAAGSKFAMHDPATWAKQAKLAAADKWEKLLELQDKLKGGK